MTQVLDPWLRYGAVLILALAVGCGTPRRDPVEIAQTVTSWYREGEEVMRSLESVDFTEPDQSMRALDTMRRAEELFAKAVRLEPTCSRCLYDLAECQRIIGLVYWQRQQGLEAEIGALIKNGSEPSRKQREELASSLETARRYFRKSNRSYLFYARNIRDVPRPIIYEHMRENYELLRDWENAATAARAYIEEAYLRGEMRAHYEKLIRAYRERILEEIEQGEE